MGKRAEIQSRILTSLLSLMTVAEIYTFSRDLAEIYTFVSEERELY